VGAACPSYGGTAYSAPTLYVACSGEVLAVRADPSGRGFSILWRKPYSGAGAPVFAFGLVWFVETGTGRLVALDPADGSQRFQYPGGSAMHFAAPAVSGDHVYAALNRSLVAVRVQVSA
jgi:outer membrane protein assembly factor BamB